MNCGFCGSTNLVHVIILKNGYAPNKSIPVICCDNCKNTLTEIAMSLSLYLTLE